MEKLFELTFQDQTLNPQVGTFTDASQTTGTFTLEDGEYYLTNADTKGFYTYKPVAMQSGLVDDGKVIIEFDLKVVTASVNTHTIIGTYAGVDGNGIPTGDKITLQYTSGDIELVLDSGTTETLIESADIVVDQWYHFRIDCALTAAIESTYEVKIDGTAVTTVTGATTDYELGIISVLGTDLHACDECGIKNITFVTETNLYVGRTALDQALTDTKSYVDTHCMDLSSNQTAAGDKTFSGLTTTHDVIPATTDTYNLGSSIKEYNNAYIKALTINGTAAGDILAHNASEFVDVSTAQTIGGIKTFSDGLFASKNGQSVLVTLEDSSINSTNEDANGMPLTGHTNSIKIKGSQLNVIPCTLIGSLFTSGNTAASLRVYKYKDINKKADIQITYVYATDSAEAQFTNCHITTNASGVYDIGSSSRQFGTAYIKALTVNGTAAGDILAHNASEFVPRSGGAVMTGDWLARTADNDYLTLVGGSAYLKGARLTLYGKDASNNKGYAYLTASDGVNGAEFVLRPGSFTTISCTAFIPFSSTVTDLGIAGNVWRNCYLVNAPIIASDARAKTQTQDVDDKLLDAWGNVEIKTYKMASAVEKKGEKARFHIGYLAQDIQAECEKQGINASDYGLFCYDEWDEQEEISEEIETEKDGKKVKEKRVIQPKREKGNSYALRYEEALVVECKYLRRCIARLTARIEELEKGNNSK